MKEFIEEFRPPLHLPIHVILLLEVSTLFREPPANNHKVTTIAHKHYKCY
jgi:hypothetical protein